MNSRSHIGFGLRLTFKAIYICCLNTGICETPFIYILKIGNSDAERSIFITGSLVLLRCTSGGWSKFVQIGYSGCWGGGGPILVNHSTAVGTDSLQFQ